LDELFWKQFYFYLLAKAQAKLFYFLCKTCIIGLVKFQANEIFISGLNQYFVQYQENRQIINQATQLVWRSKAKFNPSSIKVIPSSVT
jgi:hypothetical protein